MKKIALILITALVSNISFAAITCDEASSQYRVRFNDPMTKATVFFKNIDDTTGKVSYKKTQFGDLTCGEYGAAVECATKDVRDAGYSLVYKEIGEIKKAKLSKTSMIGSKLLANLSCSYSY